MTIDLDFLEGEHPAIRPNAGHHVDAHWTDAERRLFGDKLRRKFPNALFFEAFTWRDGENEAFKPSFVGNLDESTPGKEVDVVFPPPAWRPEIVLTRGKSLPHWSWKYYLSPIIVISARPGPDWRVQTVDWFGDAVDGTIRLADWIKIRTSYRRELESERRIQAAVLRLAVGLGRQLVPVEWASYADYRNRNGRVSLSAMRVERRFASQGIIDWTRAAPRRDIYLSVGRTCRTGESWLPPEDVSDSWWGDIPKPKWAQVPR